MGSTFSAWWPGQYVGGYADAAPHGTLGGKGPEATTPARSPTRRWRVMGSGGRPHHDVPYDSEERPCRRTTLPARPALRRGRPDLVLSLIHISEPTRLGMISYAVFC